MTGVGFHPAARAELVDAARFYDAQAEGLGGQFLDEVERVVGMLAESPGLGAPVGETGLRRWPLRRFPYRLIYADDRGALLVLAVAHEKRRPGYWSGRG